MEHQKFNYKTLDDVKAKLQELNVTLPLSDHFAVLEQPLTVNHITIPNRIAIQPMEGCDGKADGKPDELTIRRYQRFAQSGAGLIWLEAVAVVNEGRANPRQLSINADNMDALKSLVEDIKQISLKENGFEPVIIMQATHSGRYSKPNGKPEPIIAYNNPIFEKDYPISADRMITDDRLKELEEIYGSAAKMAEQAGFDGVDIKACHRYLMSELLSAYTRPGEYGGSFENRTKLYRHAIASAQANTSSAFMITSRLNIYDGFPYPNGWGVNQTDGITPDLSEPIQLVDIIHRQMGIQLLDFTIGNPYFNPHVNRPADGGSYVPDEHPLEGVARMFQCIGAVSKEYKDLAVISSGHSYLRQFSAHLAAGAIEQGISSMAGFGREAFAYPQFPNDIFKQGGMNPKKCCITCGKCTELMRAGSTAGCVIKDSEVYAPIYNRDVLKKS